MKIMDKSLIIEHKTSAVRIFVSFLKNLYIWGAGEIAQQW